MRHSIPERFRRCATSVLQARLERWRADGDAFFLADVVAHPMAVLSEEGLLRFYLGLFPPRSPSTSWKETVPQRSC